MPTVQVDQVVFGAADFPVIAGPCVIESREHALKMSTALAGIAARLELSLIYKSSFDKANRTSIDAYRGPALETGLEILAEVKKESGLPVTTDIHFPPQAGVVAEVVDVIQIPAFLCRQTDLLVAAAETGKVINIKKGQFLSPWKMKHVVQKVERAGNRNILLTERGSSYGYEHLVSDLRSIPIMQQESGYPVIFDATHSAQSPGAGGEHTSGLRAYIPTLARAATAAGCDGLFLEVHDDVEQARSDAATQWPLDQVEELLRDLQRIRQALGR